MKIARAHYLDWAREVAKTTTRHNASEALAQQLSRKNLQPTNITFHLFPCLPPELRGKIFAMAAEPPPCPHYYDGFNIAHGGNEPSAEFMTDRGLWTATKESRWQIQNEYRKAAERLAGGNTHFCYEYRTGENVRMHRRLGYLNKTVVTFFEQLHSLPREIKMLRQLAADNLRELVMDLANDIKANEVHSDFAPTWEDGEVRPTTAELQEVCQALADEYLT